MKEKSERYDVVVCGGGLAGFSAAVAAARQGMKTCLIQDRPVLGGNSSSEIRVTPHGAAAFHYYARETGIVSEALVEERARNHEPIFENGWTNSVWDMVLYDIAVSTPNLTLRLNTSCQEVEMDETGRRLVAVRARVANGETLLTIRGAFFVDATGDAVIAAGAGCSYRWGSEGKEEFGEAHAPEKGRRDDVMGNSIHFKTKDVGREAPFEPPEWAISHEDPDYFYSQGRKPKDVRGGFWWIEIGKPYDTIFDAEDIRHELTRHTLGVWDWIKNKDPKTKEAAKTWALDWIGQVPGKRESRRIEGRYMMTENDIQERRVFDDEIAFGGWFLDLHTPGGLLAEHSEANSKENYSPYSDRVVASYVGPYGIPLRVLLAKDVDNLLLAGRDLSVTHAAFGSVRVMATGAILGQAAGTAAAHALKAGQKSVDLSPALVRAVQQQLLRDGCFLPNRGNEDTTDKARSARVSASSDAPFHGAGPDSPSFHEGLDIWWDQYNPQITDRLDSLRGQLLAVGAERIDRLAFYLTNESNVEEEIEVTIRRVEHIWDYRVESSPPIISGKLRLPAESSGWHWIDTNLDTRELQREQALIRVDLSANDKVLWHPSSRVEPGLVSMFEIGRGYMRTYQQGVTMSVKVEPGQRCYPPENVINGWTRPYRQTNLWRSDPSRPLDQWLALEWDSPVELSSVELTFPGHLLREYHAYGPFYRDPQCPRDYTIEVLRENESWEPVVDVTDNYQRHRKHPVDTSRETGAVRITVHKTNGDPSAAIYEVRCY